MIAAAAGVNWSLLGYYFRGKEGCLSEVYRRHCGDLNSAGMRLLQETRANGRQPQLEEILNAFIRPALAVARGEDGQTAFIRLRAIWQLRILHCSTSQSPKTSMFLAPHLST